MVPDISRRGLLATAGVAVGPLDSSLVGILHAGVVVAFLQRTADEW